jgi:hypothetical protein
LRLDDLGVISTLLAFFGIPVFAIWFVISDSARVLSALRIAAGETEADGTRVRASTAGRVRMGGLTATLLTGC